MNSWFLREHLMAKLHQNSRKQTIHRPPPEMVSVRFGSLLRGLRSFGVFTYEQKIMRTALRLQKKDQVWKQHMSFQSEPDPDFTMKITIFTAFCSKWEFHAFFMKLTHKCWYKWLHEARINQAFGLKTETLVFVLTYSFNKIFWMPLNFCENDQKCWWGKS